MIRNPVLKLDQLASFDVVRGAWCDDSRHGSPTYKVTCKLRKVKADLRIWNKQEVSWHNSGRISSPGLCVVSMLLARWTLIEDWFEILSQGFVIWAFLYFALEIQI